MILLLAIFYWDNCKYPLINYSEWLPQSITISNIQWNKEFTALKSPFLWLCIFIELHKLNTKYFVLYCHIYKMKSILHNSYQSLAASPTHCLWIYAFWMSPTPLITTPKKLIKCNFQEDSKLELCLNCRMRIFCGCGELCDLHSGSQLFFPVRKCINNNT